MEKVEFTKRVEYFDEIYGKIETISENIMKNYSFDGKIEKIDFDERTIPIIDNCILYNGQDLLKITYNSEVKEDNNLNVFFNIFGNNIERLDEIKKELKLGLEDLL